MGWPGRVRNAAKAPATALRSGRARVLFVHEPHNNQQLNTHHADGVLEGQDLPSSLVLVRFSHGNALGVRNNAAAAGRAWDVGVVLVFVFLQFS